MHTAGESERRVRESQDVNRACVLQLNCMYVVSNHSRVVEIYIYIYIYITCCFKMAISSHIISWFLNVIILPYNPKLNIVHS